VRGKVWYSYDNGKTWTRRPRKLKALRGAAFTVTGVDYERGIVSISATIDGDVTE